MGTMSTVKECLTVQKEGERTAEGWLDNVQPLARLGNTIQTFPGVHFT